MKANLVVRVGTKEDGQANLVVMVGTKKISMKANLVVMVGTEEDGYEGKPDDTRRVHGESDILRLIEVL